MAGVARVAFAAVGYGLNMPKTVGRSGKPVGINFEQSTTVPVAPAAAFAIADMASLADWNPAVTRSELLEGDPLVKGARYACTLARGPLRLQVFPELVDVVPERLVVYAGKFGFAHSTDTIEFAPEGQGTRLTFRNQSQLPVWARPFTLPITAAFHRQARRAVLGAVDYLNGQLPSRG